jgi:hypothetical protein
LGALGRWTIGLVVAFLKDRASPPGTDAAPPVRGRAVENDNLDLHVANLQAAAERRAAFMMHYE